MKKQNRILSLVVLLLICISTQAEPLKKDSSKIKDPRSGTLVGFPFAFFTPETKWGGGAGGMYAFYFNREDSVLRPSSIQLGFAYTQLKQLLIYLPWQLFLKKNEYYSYGEVGYYLFNFNYYGIGPQSKSEDEEVFEVQIPRLRLNMYRKVTSGLYLGMRYWYDDYTLTEIEEDGMLAEMSTPGHRGGMLSGLGPSILYDTRDMVFFPHSGYYLEGLYQSYQGFLGSAYSFNRFLFDLRSYTSFFNSKLVWVNQVYSQLQNGNIPFNEMSLLGGTKRNRGYYEGRFRDHNSALFQTELRWPFWWRLGVVGFYSVGTVFSNSHDLALSNWKHSGGVGLRFLIDKHKMLNARFDVGVTNEGTNFYVTFGEAF